MAIYLPIAELSVNALVLLCMGAAVGFLSGMFGVGGGFLITPLLIFYNIPPAVAVATGANQIVASSVSGVLSHLRHKGVDIKLGVVLLIGGIAGSSIGVIIYTYLLQVGQLDLIISVLYVLMLGIVGALMLKESVSAWRKSRAGTPVAMRKPGQHNWIHRLPMKMRFKQSRLYISVIPVVLLGAVIGMLAAIMGVGGGFILVPAMIYLLRVPTNVVIGTSL
ncbi:MAG: sulfite exporter TauE/SafE family protein, partial [Pseudomonadota bacterium]